MKARGGISEKSIVEVLLLRLSDAVIGGAVTTKVAKLLDLLSDFEDVAQIVEHAKTVRKVSLFQECIKLARVMQFLEKHMEFRCKGIAPVPKGGVGEVEMIGVNGVVKKPKPITQFYGRMVLLCCSGHPVGFAYCTKASQDKLKFQMLPQLEQQLRKNLRSGANKAYVLVTLQFEEAELSALREFAKLHAPGSDPHFALRSYLSTSQNSGPAESQVQASLRRTTLSSSEHDTA